MIIKPISIFMICININIYDYKTYLYISDLSILTSLIIKPISILLIYTKTNIIIYDHQTDKTNFLHRAVKFKRFHKNVKSKNAIKN